MAYPVVLERPNNPEPIRWKWYVEKNDGHRTVRLDEGACATAEDAARECDESLQQRESFRP